MASVRSGHGRETAYDAVKQHAVAVALEMREKGAAENDLFARLAADERLGLSEADLASLVASPIDFTGAAVSQVQAVVGRIEQILAANPEAAAYTPGSIL